MQEYKLIFSRVTDEIFRIRAGARVKMVNRVFTGLCLCLCVVR